MTHFQRFAVRGYRSITRADLKLGQITVVIGPSDTGKSNLIRAFRDWAFNPTGEDFLTAGASFTRLVMVVANRYKVLWERTSNDEHLYLKKPKHRKKRPPGVRYVLQDANSGELPLSFQKIGRTVPEEISGITGVRKLVIDDLEVRPNISQQDDPWFLLSNPPWTPMKVTKVIGHVSGIDALILANKDVVLEHGRCRNQVKSHHDRADELRVELEKYATIEEARKLADQAQEKLAELKQGMETFEKATNILRGIVASRERFKKAQAAATVLRKATDRAEQLDLVANMEKLAQAEQVLQRVEWNQRAIEGNATKKTGLLEELHRLQTELTELADADDLRCPLCGEKAHSACRSSLKRQAGEGA